MPFSEKIMKFKFLFSKLRFLKPEFLVINKIHC